VETTLARGGPITEERLQALRTRIDDLDHRLLQLLSERRELVQNIGAINTDAGLPVRHPEREAALLADHAGRAEALGLDPTQVQALFETLLAWSRSEQELG
jgi:chorismate mutase-like protein